MSGIRHQTHKKCNSLLDGYLNISISISMNYLMKSFYNVEVVDLSHA